MQMIIVGAFVVVAALVGYFFIANENAVPMQTEAKQEIQVNTNPNLNQAPVQNADNTVTYKSGVYTSVGTYASPAGPEEVSVGLTLDGNIIKSATFKGQATNKGSVANQAKFAAGFESMVVGKSIDEVNLTVVNGSSLTTKGFMDALSKIKTQAKM